MGKNSAKAIETLSESSDMITQEHRERAPLGWAEVQDQLAEAAGLSVLLVEGHQPPALVVSNNNSICQAFQSSPEYVGRCDPYCGTAHQRATTANARLDYKCHAGLQCFAKPLEFGDRNLVTIGGRAFTSAADYRAFAERFRAGELNELLDRNPFENIIFNDEQKIEELAQRVDKASHRLQRQRGRTAAAPASKTEEVINREAVIPASLEPKQASPAPIDAPNLELQREVDRLRGELTYRTNLDESLQSFLGRINSTDAQQTYESILTNSKELLRANRASLWVFDETADEIILRASAGLPAEVGADARTRLGEGVASRVLESGKPLVVRDITSSDLAPAAATRNYETKSFISYPLTIGERKIGLLNVTDKVSGKNFDDVDLNLLEMVGPQIAVALERAEWQERATQFQLMSITDPLTGLLNRRYLEERLTEELNRSRRYNYSMSCLMIDIDDFKKYNDNNGHQAGDLALKITAHSLKAALRSADIACRYGGEEFCILLPQTSVSEAGVIAERMRLKVTETDYPHGRSQPMGTVSISIGISTLGRHIDTAESIISAADRALYAAKNKGKNRIEFYVDNLTDPTNNQ